MFRYYSSFFIFSILLQGISQNATAQYFYRDIWNPKQLIKEFKTLKNENIKTVSVKSFEGDGEASEGFFCEKRINKNYTLAETFTKSYTTNKSILTSSFDINGLILKTIDSTETSISRTEYEYDNKERIKTVKTFTRAGDEAGGIGEVHEYFYTAEGNLEKMINKKNNSIASEINFIIDDKGNVLEEDEKINGSKRKKYFYYYDDKNRLTDIVHYNERAKRLLPDYVFEYNSAGQIEQMISTEEGSSNYYIWRYTYNDKNLKKNEVCLSKEKKMLGRVEYEYR